MPPGDWGDAPMRCAMTMAGSCAGIRTRIRTAGLGFVMFAGRKIRGFVPRTSWPTRRHFATFRNYNRQLIDANGL